MSPPLPAGSLLPSQTCSPQDYPCPLSQQMSRFSSRMTSYDSVHGPEVSSIHVPSTPATLLCSFSRMSLYIFVMLSVYHGIASSHARLLASRAPILSSCIPVEPSSCTWIVSFNQTSINVSTLLSCQAWPCATIFNLNLIRMTTVCESN